MSFPRNDGKNAIDLAKGEGHGFGTDDAPEGVAGPTRFLRTTSVVLFRPKSFESWPGPPLGLQLISAFSNAEMISIVLSDDVGALVGCMWAIYTSYPLYLILSDG